MAISRNSRTTRYFIMLFIFLLDALRDAQQQFYRSGGKMKNMNAIIESATQKDFDRQSDKNEIQNYPFSGIVVKAP